MDMIQHADNGLPYWQFPTWKNYTQILHFMTGRQGGVSPAPWNSLNTSLSAGDDTGRVLQNRQLIAEAMGVSTNQLVFPQQVSEAAVAHVTEIPDSPEVLKATDALITQTPGLCLCVQTADCAPLFFYDTRQHAIGIAHAGWRGMVKNIAGETVRAMESHFGTRPTDIVAAIGPAIGPQVYEIGEDVAAIIRYVFGRDTDNILTKQKKKKYLLNIWQGNAIMLERAEIPGKQITVAKQCTYKQSKQFFSARKNGKTGRQTNGLLLKRPDAV